MSGFQNVGLRMYLPGYTLARFNLDLEACGSECLASSECAGFSFCHFACPHTCLLKYFTATLVQSHYPVVSYVRGRFGYLCLNTSTTLNRLPVGFVYNDSKQLFTYLLKTLHNYCIVFFTF